VRTPQTLPGGYRLDRNILDFQPLLGALLSLRGDVRTGAELFHGTLIAGLVAWTSATASQLGMRKIALGGGCFMNRILSGGLAEALRERGLTPLLPHAVPANDGGLSLGQVYLGREDLLGHSAARDRKDNACASPSLSA
jgi:hydrogenase maturation protein HypF